MSKVDSSPEAIARRKTRRELYYSGLGEFTNTQQHMWRELQHKARQAREEKNPRKKVAMRVNFHKLLANTTGDRMVVRWDTFDRVNQRTRGHHPWVGHDKFIAEGMAPMPMLPTLADLALCIRAERLDLWSDAVLRHTTQRPDEVLWDLWADETHPLRLVRCLLGTQLLPAAIQSLPRYPCREHTLHDSMWRYAVYGDRTLWPGNDYACSVCCNAIRAGAFPKISTLRLRQPNPPVNFFGRLSVGRAKRSNTW